MHPEAYDGARRMIEMVRELGNIDPAAEMVGLDLGGADVNGTARDLLPCTTWFGLDAEPGPGVEHVADARFWEPDRAYDVVLCTELLEHVYRPEECVATAHKALRPGGHLFLTCAATGRRPHGARGAAAPAYGEWYHNIGFVELGQWLSSLFGAGLDRLYVEYRPNPGDLYAWARK